jgi:hypothetical protein
LTGVSDWQQSPQEVSKSWIGISHLEKGTSYEIRLSVTNGITLDPNPGLTVIKLSSTIFIVILQNYPIRTKYLFDAVL